MLKKKIVLIFILLMLLSTFVNAEKITLRGEPRTPDNQIELMYGLDTFDKNGQKIQGLKEIINNDDGYFEVKDVEIPVTIWVLGSCILHTFNIQKEKEHFAIKDAHEPNKLIQNSPTNDINLGVLKEDKSVYVSVISDIPVTFSVEDLNGEWIAGNGAYKKEQGNFGSLKPKTQYKIILKDKNEKEYSKIISTGDYCYGTRLIKKGNYFEVENFPKNIFPKISFFKKINLFFKGLFS